MSWWGWALIGACVFFIVVPPKWDPVIRWAERQERERHRKAQERFRNKDWYL